MVLNGLKQGCPFSAAWKCKHGKLQDEHGGLLHHGNMERAAKVLERMENQNTYKELAMDFKVSTFVSVYIVDRDQIP